MYTIQEQKNSELGVSDTSRIQEGLPCLNLQYWDYLFYFWKIENTDSPPKVGQLAGLMLGQRPLNKFLVFYFPTEIECNFSWGTTISHIGDSRFVILYWQNSIFKIIITCILLWCDLIPSLDHIPAFTVKFQKSQFCTVWGLQKVHHFFFILDRGLGQIYCLRDSCVCWSSSR